jgi:hypothetical protein
VYRQEVELRQQRGRQMLEAADALAAQCDAMLLRNREEQFGSPARGKQIRDVDIRDLLRADVLAVAGACAAHGIGLVDWNQVHRTYTYQPRRFLRQRGYSSPDEDEGDEHQFQNRLLI